jgi:hypothetical protein
MSRSSVRTGRLIGHIWTFFWWLGAVALTVATFVMVFLRIDWARYVVAVRAGLATIGAFMSLLTMAQLAVSPVRFYETFGLILRILELVISLASCPTIAGLMLYNKHVAHYTRGRIVEAGDL